jgi:hypothetical protein
MRSQSVAPLFNFDELGLTENGEQKGNNWVNSNFLGCYLRSFAQPMLQTIRFGISYSDATLWPEWLSLRSIRLWPAFGRGRGHQIHGW